MFQDCPFFAQLVTCIRTVCSECLLALEETSGFYTSACPGQPTRPQRRGLQVGLGAVLTQRPQVYLLPTPVPEATGSRGPGGGRLCLRPSRFSLFVP